MLATGIGIACAGALGGGPGCGEIELASAVEDCEPPWQPTSAASAARTVSRVARIVITP
jgi:hypothetical protein